MFWSNFFLEFYIFKRLAQYGQVIYLFYVSHALYEINKQKFIYWSTDADNGQGRVNEDELCTVLSMH